MYKRQVLVCIAVWAAMSSEQVSGKILALYPPVAIFILCGFEHCIANMSVSYTHLDVYKRQECGLQ